MFDEAEKIRVGEFNSPVDAGDFSPNFKRYVRGQFAPTVDRLASEKLSEAEDSGVVDNEDEAFKNINIKDGKEIENWDYNLYFSNFGYGISVDEKIPPYAVVSSYFAFKTLPTNLLKFINIRNLKYNETDGQLVEGIDAITGAETQTSKTFRSSVVIFPKYYRFISIPIVRQIPGRKFGLSIANYSIFHTLGHIYLKKLTFQGKFDSISSLLKVNGWEKNTTEGIRGSFLDQTNKSNWRRDGYSGYLTESAKYSPEDNFAETFAHYYTNRAVLKLMQPQLYESINTMLKGYDENISI